MRPIQAMCRRSHPSGTCGITGRRRRSLIMEAWESTSHDGARMRSIRRLAERFGCSPNTPGQGLCTWLRGVPIGPRRLPLLSTPAVATTTSAADQSGYPPVTPSHFPLESDSACSSGPAEGPSATVMQE